MTLRLKVSCLAAFCWLSPLPAQNLAKLVSVSGSVYWFNTSGERSKPCRQWPVRLMPATAVGPGDTVATKTDAFGQYAFYGVPAGNYKLEISRGFGRVFQEQVKVPQTVAPIVLPPRLPAVADSVNPIRVHSDYEVLGPKRYRFKLWTEVPPEWKALVSKVVYHMDHPSFTQKELFGTDPKMDFEADYVGWGCLEKVSVEVVFPQDVWNLTFPFCADLQAKAEANRKAEPPVK